VNRNQKGGFHREYCIDFDEIFSLIVKITTLQFLPGIVMIKDLEFKTTFLHGDPDEEIYIYGTTAMLHVTLS
jgi:hypothetical protein